MRRGRRSKELYFDWLVDLVDGSDVYDICKFMDEVKFFCIDPMDEARIYDAYRLREDYCYNFGEDLGNRDQNGCSFFEFLVAFSTKIESEIMYNWDHGDQTSVWFHLMLENILENWDNWDQLRERLEKVMMKELHLFGDGPNWSQSNPTFWMEANAYFIRVSG